MMRLVIPILLLSLFLSIQTAEGQTITAPRVKQSNNDLLVSFALVLDEKHNAEVRAGIDKDLRFYVDLFKVWKSWPDEFVVGKVIEKTLKVDPIKKEYVATSFDGSTLVERRFRSFDSMTNWALIFNNVKVASVRDLEPGEYYVKVSAASKVRKLPPMIGQFLLIFVSEDEFKVSADSAVFTVSGAK